MKSREQSIRKTKNVFLQLWSFLVSFPFILYLNTVFSKFNLPMDGFERQISGVGSNCTANFATTVIEHRSNFKLLNRDSNPGPQYGMRR